MLRACHCETVDVPPVWMMRQAGRVLPEYRALKERYTFLDLVRTPDLATEVTLQPIRRFDFDAAILFSDILVIPEALGQGYHFRETGGVEMDFRVSCRADIDRLDATAVAERLAYVFAALRQIRAALGPTRALLGFAGAPWTLANYMIEGGSSSNEHRALALFKEDPELFGRLMSKLTGAVAQFLRMQIAAGADAVQIFDSNAGELPTELYAEASGRWIEQIVQEVRPQAPVIVFARGGRDWATLNALGANVLGIDHEMTLSSARALVPDNIALQGNLPPESLISLSAEEISAQTRQLLQVMEGRPGYIFNLGHGVPPEGRLENIAAVVQTVRASGRSLNRPAALS